MDGFSNYLVAKRLTSPKGADFYLHWVTRFYRYCSKNPGDPVSKSEMEGYLRSLSKNHEDWQVEQAVEAIKLYRFYKKRNKTDWDQKTLGSNAQWKAVAVSVKIVVA